MSQEIIILLPAGMKPMHGGHIDLIKRYSTHPDVKEVQVLIGPSKRDLIDQELSLEIARFLTRNIEKVSIVETNHPTPVTSLYKYMETVDCGNFAIGASTKSNDYKTVTKFVENFAIGGKYHHTLPECVKAVELNLDFTPLMYKGRNDQFEGTPISATVVRNDISDKNIELFLTSYPGIEIEDSVTVWNMIIAKTEKSTNLHMQHIEDLLFNDGLAGIIRCKNLMEKIGTTLRKENKEVSITTKYDGTPAVFCWSSFPGLPNDGISIKGLFNKEPQIFRTVEDIVCTSLPDDLKDKLLQLLIYLPELNIPTGEIWQGDVMYNLDSLKIEDIDGYPALSFHPNTICYTPKTMQDYRRIKNSEMGIVWHTIYTGESLETVKCGYNVDISRLGHCPYIYMIDPYIRYKDIHPIISVYIEPTQYENYTDSLKHLYRNSSYLNMINDKTFVEYLTLYYNKLIREQNILEIFSFVRGFKEFVYERFKNKIESMKTDIAKSKYTNQMNDLMTLININEQNLIKMQYIRRRITSLKTAIVNELDTYSTFYTHFKTLDGKFIETNHEGYAINDGYNIVKFVNRYEFSRANFSDEFVKGWVNEKRRT